MLKQLYFGKVIPWERRGRKNEEQLELVRKIDEEERYFVSKMSLDDCARFRVLSNLYTELGLSEEGEIFSYGFTMGALLMKDILDEVEAMTLE